jgi:hypothetical protein
MPIRTQRTDQGSNRIIAQACPGRSMVHIKPVATGRAA